MSAGHGGQILLSDPAQQALSAEPGIQLRSLGEHRLKGLGAPVRIFQLLVDGLPEDFPDLRLDGATSGPSRQFGDAIRGYEVRERLAAGRISVVYRAFQPTVGREVAVKVIRPEYANHPSFVRRFESEARTVAGLEHPHIVSLYDYWRDADGAYLVMPLMAGGSLADKNLGALPLDRVAEMIGQVGSALGYAHRQGVIHVTSSHPTSSSTPTETPTSATSVSRCAGLNETPASKANRRSIGLLRTAPAPRWMSAPMCTAWRGSLPG
jgi:hypothetical protein